MKTKVLLVEDDIALSDVLLEAIALKGHNGQAVSSAEAALELLKNEEFDVIVTDINLPGMTGLDFLPHCFRLRPNSYVIVITGYGTIEKAVEAMKRGAADFITKPIALSDLTSVIQVGSENSTRKKATQSRSVSSSSTKIICKSPVMLRLLDTIASIATYNSTVLITGETGTGKELIARAIHEQSPRSERELVAFNCAAVPEQLLDDELFGHVKGAFTGAQTAREGRFERADKGSLFLDEIGDMTLPLQSKLLRVLQEREFEKIGSSKPIKVDVRVIAATSANIDEMIQKGTFRADLYYRLNVINLKIPPLRERVEDIPPIAQHLLWRFCDSAGLPKKTISDDAFQALCMYRWPGNVRQLQNAMERAAAFTGGAPEIHLTDLPEEVRSGSPSGITPILSPEYLRQNEATIPDEGLSFDAIVSSIEKDLLLQSLEKAGGNKQRAAKLLNMKRTTFIEKLKRLQINTENETIGDDDSESE